VTGITSDFLTMKKSEFPELENSNKNVVFLSPSWGGMSYSNM